jgi:hypothetical protein
MIRDRIDKECKKHGITAFVEKTKGKYKTWGCVKCRYDAIVRKRKKIKDKCVEYKGGKCEICGYCKSKRALCFHHIDPSKKDFTVSAATSKSWEIIKQELDKCKILCSNCHMELHEEE